MLNHRRLSRPSGPMVIPVILEKCTLPPQLAHIAGFDLTVGALDQRLDEISSSLAELLRKRTIFVCHSSHDKAEVGRIVQSLRRRRNLDVWYDSQSMKAGGIIRREIEAGISKAPFTALDHCDNRHVHRDSPAGELRAQKRSEPLGNIPGALTDARSTGFEPVTF